MSTFLDGRSFDLLLKTFVADFCVKELDSESIAKFGHVDVPSAVMKQSTGKEPILYPHGGRWSAVPNREEASSSPSPPANVDSPTITEKDLHVKPSLWPDPLEAFRDELTSQQLK